MWCATGVVGRNIRKVVYNRSNELGTILKKQISTYCSGETERIHDLVSCTFNFEKYRNFAENVGQKYFNYFIMRSILV
jgi:hypothetical protein